MEQEQLQQNIVDAIRRVVGEVIVNEVRRHIREEVRPSIQEELRNTATKDDLKSFATKDDLKSFATKDDLEKFKNEMSNDFKEFGDLAFKTFATKQDLKESEEKMARIFRNERDITLISNDRVINKMAKVDQEQAADTIGNIRRDERIDDLEDEVRKVKIKLGMASSIV